MIEWVEIGNARLGLGDCREILPEVQADVLITDPVWPNASPGLIGSDDPSGLLRTALEVLNPVKRLVIVLRHDSDPRFLTAVPAHYPFFRTQTLPYAVPAYIGRKLGCEEMAYCFGEPIPSAPGQRVIPGRGPMAQPTDKTDHPCPRPLIHFRWLVHWHSTPDEVICDPFMGSSTTGVACVELGRRFIGIEIDERYFENAVKRVTAAQRQAPLFQVAPPTEQNRLFA
jgi:site-specific DNA-methyltransferase (adenine-specific)